MREREVIDVSGRSVLITGAGRGIGRSLAIALAERGARVGLTARTESQLKEVAAAIRSSGGEAVIAVGDVTSETDTKRMADAVVGAFGSLDILINNAGILRSGTIVDMSADDWDTVMATNLRGFFLCTKVCARHMMGAGRGKIVNVASTYGLTPVRGYAAYCSSKAAILQFTRVAALEFAKFGLQVNAIAPGYIETDFNAEALADESLRARVIKRIPAARIATPNELLPAVAFLASPASDYITGATITIDGGFSIN